MTREEELALLIEEQANDDVPWINPEPIVSLSLDQSIPGTDGILFHEAIGVFDDGMPFSGAKGRVRRGMILRFGRVPHGTENGYSNYDCRCPECRKAHNAKFRDWYARNRAREGWHGTIGGYTNHACRCSRCTGAWRRWQRQNKGIRISRPTCPHCKQRFFRGRSDQVWCSASCRDSARRRRNGLTEPTCEHCGNKFPIKTTGGIKRYCSPKCKLAVRNARKRERMKDNRDPTCVGLKLLSIADDVRKTHPEMKLSAIADANGLHCPPWTGDGFMSNNPAEHHSQTPQAHLAVGTSSASPSAPGFSE